MSEDTDERMERATRIRQMREGQRESLDADGDSDDSGDDTEDTRDADPASSDADGSLPDDSGTGEQGPQANTVEQEDEADTRDQAVGDVRNDGDSGRAVDSDGDETTETNSGGSDGPDEEGATAAAQRAAQAAAQMGGGSTGETTNTGAATEAAPATEDAPVTETDQPSPGDGPATQMQGPTGLELPDRESLQAAMAEEGIEPGSGAAPGSASGRSPDAQNATTAEETVRVLEFTLGDEHYCLDIAHVEEIVKRESITRVPNTPDYVEGVVDLRGQITTILDPKLLLDIDGDGPESLLVVFEPDAFDDQGAIGWVVDEVRQVAPIAKSEVSAAPVDADYIEGVIDRDDEDEFVIWTNPEVAIKLAIGARDED